MLAAPGTTALAILIEPYDSTVVSEMAFEPLPGGTVPLGDWAIPLYGAPLPIMLGTADFVTSASDTLPDYGVAGRIVEALNLSLSAFDGIEPGGDSRASSNKGAITVADPSGAFDDWEAATLGWDGRPVTIRRGTIGTDTSTWPVVASLYSAGLTYNDERKIIGLRDLRGSLEQAPLLRAYGGGGGLDGDAAMAGRPIPRGWGRNYAVPATLMVAASLVYQVHDGAVSTISDVYDGGSRLGDPTYPDYPDLAALVAATVAVGDVATCVASGLFRLGGQPTFKVLCGFRGDASGAGYVETRGAIARRIATVGSRLTVRDPVDLDTGSFDDFETAFPEPVGAWFGDFVSVADALTRVLSPVMAAWAFGTSGLMSLGWLRDPADLTADIDVDARQIRGTPEMVTWQAARYATDVEWRRIDGPLALGEMAGIASLTEAERRLWSTEHTLASIVDPSILTLHPTAPRITMRAGFASEDDAAAFGVVAQELMGTRRERWRIQVAMDPYTDVLFKVFYVTGYTRHGWSGGKKALCVGMNATASADTVTLDLWC